MLLPPLQSLRLPFCLWHVCSSNTHSALSIAAIVAENSSNRILWVNSLQNYVGYVKSTYSNLFDKQRFE